MAKTRIWKLTDENMNEEFVVAPKGMKENDAEKQIADTYRGLKGEPKTANAVAIHLFYTGWHPLEWNECNFDDLAEEV